MSLANFTFVAFGGPKTRVAITDQSVSDSGLGSRTATYTLTNTGLVQDHDATTLENWVTPTTAAGAAYEVRATLVPYSGTLSAGTTGSWLVLSSTRSWSVTAATTGSADASITVEIRLAASGTVLDSASIILHAESI